MKAQDTHPKLPADWSDLDPGTFKGREMKKRILA
jgi:hypothetical protein